MQKGKFIIIMTETGEIFKDVDGSIAFFDSEIEAGNVCGFYELDGAWVVELKYKHKEE